MDAAPHHPARVESVRAPTRRATSACRRGRAGFTLLEMLVVVAIVGVLMGIGASGYMSFSRGYGITSVESRLESIVRQARNQTIYENAPAGAFVIDAYRLELRDPIEFIEGELLAEDERAITFLPEGRIKPIDIPLARIARRAQARSVRAIGFNTIAVWHLETDATVGYLGRSCRPEGCTQIMGKIGGALALNESPRARSRITALRAADDGQDPYLLPSGGRIALWAYAESPNPGYLFRREKSYSLKMTAEGKLEATVGSSTVASERGKTVYIMPLGRWVYVALRFTPTEIDISVDGISRGTGECTGIDPVEKANLVFGDGFGGCLDEIRVQGRVAGESLDVPEGFEFQFEGVPDGMPAIFFDHRGRLDKAHHARPVSVKILRDGRDVDAGFTVSMNGLIE